MIESWEIKTFISPYLNKLPMHFYYSSVNHNDVSHGTGAHEPYRVTAESKNHCLTF